MQLIRIMMEKIWDIPNTLKACVLNICDLYLRDYDVSIIIYQAQPISQNYTYY